MRTLAFLLLTVPIAFGQIRSNGGGGNRGGGYGGGTAWGHPSGFGNILFPGTGRAPTGIGPNRIVAARPLPAGAGQRVVYWPIGYGGYYQPQPEVIVIQQQPAVQQPAPAQPSVIINQNFTPQTASNPIVREYNWDTPRDQSPVRADETARSRSGEEEKRPFLIALRDHTIYAAFTYWMEGETLHYVTTHGTHNQVSMTLVDRDFSERLNRERGIRFEIK